MHEGIEQAIREALSQYVGTDVLKGEFMLTCPAHRDLNPMIWALTEAAQQAAAVEHARLLRLAASGRRDYIRKYGEPIDDHGIAMAAELEHEAQRYEFAAQIIEDPESLKGCLPTERWGEIEEMKS